MDAIDTVSCKLDLIEQCCRRGIPIISSMGTGNRLDPTRFCLGDIGDTAGCGCGLARVLRRGTQKRGIAELPVVYSTEPPQKTLCLSEDQPGRHSPASISFCPPAAGYCLASYVVRRLIRRNPGGIKPYFSLHTNPMRGFFMPNLLFWTNTLCIQLPHIPIIRLMKGTSTWYK